MTGFNDRGKAFESKWANDEESRFRVMARRNRLAGLWAADLKGLSGVAAEEFAVSVVTADFEEKGDEDVFRKLRSELDASVSDAVIREKMQTLLAVAADELQAK